MAGLDNLKHEIGQEAEQGAKKLLEQAEQECRELVRNAEKEAKLKEKRAEEEAEELLKAEKAERIAAARLEAKKIISEGQEEAMGESLAKVWHEFGKLAKDEGYAALLKKLIGSGVGEVGGKSVVYVRKEDRELARGSGAELAEKSIDCTGGAIIESRDGRVRVNNTFEQIFEDKKDEIRKSVHEKLFSKKKEE